MADLSRVAIECCSAEILQVKATDVRVDYFANLLLRDPIPTRTCHSVLSLHTVRNLFQIPKLGV